MASPRSNRRYSAAVSGGGRRCPICGQPLLRTTGTPHVTSLRCPGCGHTVAEHRSGAESAVDYHRQYDEGEFLGSLATTRRRQAKAILGRIRAQLPDADALLDFGAGRGWFLDEARASGMTRLAGTDTSSDAVSGLRERGTEGVLIPPPTESAWDVRLGTLSFRPRIVTFLDVIEHFPAERLSSMFAGIVDQLRPELELVAIKVPVSDGFLYRTAGVLARAGVTGPLDQLYQVGTFPPHYSYFSRRSLAELLARHGLKQVDAFGLLEFDPSTFGSRVAALRRAPRAATRLLGATTALVAERTTQDSYVALARPIARGARS
jgi:hypothetical protein